MKETLWADMLAAKVIKEQKGSFYKHLLWGVLLRPTFACVFWYRINRAMYLRRFPNLLTLVVSVWRFYRFGNDISYMADIGMGFTAGHVHGIVIGAGVKIGSHCLVRHNVTIGSATNDTPHIKPTIGNHVEIGAQTVVIGGITIGDRAKIGTMSLINKDVAADTLVFGIPPNQTVKPLHDQS